MNETDLATMEGEWFGTGEMIFGAETALINEHLTIKRTDNTKRLMYTRISRIEGTRGIQPHHEIGYTGLEDISFLLSRGTYVQLKWNEDKNIFLQSAGTSETINMKRKIILNSGHEMVWDSEMEIFTRGQNSPPVSHKIVTSFSLVGLDV